MLESTFRLNKKDDKEKFDMIKILLKALNLKSENEVFKYMYVDVTNIYCIDGHRCHRIKAEAFEIDRGYYEVVKNTQKEIILIKVDCCAKYPATAAIFNKTAYSNRHQLKESMLIQSDPVFLSQQLKKIYATAGLVNFAYVQDCAAGFEYNVKYEEINENLAMKLFLTFGSLEIVIMGMQIQE